MLLLIYTIWNKEKYPNKLLIINIWLQTKINNLICRFLNKKNQTFNLLFFYKILYVIVFFNYIRFCIYESRLCSSILFNLFISISIWISFLVASLVSNRKKLILHFSNKNLNIFSIFFIFLSELIRIIIRPFVLSIRLIANLTIGHYLINIFLSIGIYFLLPYSLFLLIELLVVLIQSLIFTILLTFYYSEA